MARFKILHEVTNGEVGNWHLCFQWGIYLYDNGEAESGYRFIWRRPDGTLQAARGQARIPSATDIFELIQLATQKGLFITTEK